MISFMNPFQFHKSENLRKSASQMRTVRNQITLKAKLLRIH